MKINQLYSRRNSKWQNYAQAIIYEWEDIISREWHIPVVNLSPSIITKAFRRIGIEITIHFSNSIRFVVNGKDYDCLMNDSHIVPCIIDFCEIQDQLQEFYRKHSKNKIVLLSTPFDYQYLKKNNCPIPIGLFAYSLPDDCLLEENCKVEKKYDIVLTGRQDPLLYSFFVEYVNKHPEVTYVKRGQGLENDFQKTKGYFLNGKDYIGDVETREEFINLQSQGRVTLYGLQGYEKGLCGDGIGFYHVTPHFLEIIACASHVIAHYPSGEDGIDAQYYEINKFSPSIENYPDFEVAMDNALNTEIDLKMYSAYLKKHYTSVRAKQLKKILESL